MLPQLKQEKKNVVVTWKRGVTPTDISPTTCQRSGFDFNSMSSTFGIFRGDMPTINRFFQKYDVTYYELDDSTQLQKLAEDHPAARSLVEIRLGI